MKLYIIRHGETEDNKKRVIQGAKDGRLSKKGIIQSKALAKLLSKEKIEVILTSELERAKETARIISKFHPNVDLLSKEELNERNYGIYNGAEVLKVNKKHSSVESDEDLKKRARKIIDFLQSNNFQNIAIVSHGSISKRIINLLSKTEKINFLKNGSLTIVEINKEKNKLIKLNSTDHLEKEIILMGGGDYRKNENEKIDNYIINKVGKRANFIFIPFAVSDPEKRKKRIGSIISIYSKQRIENFETLDEEKMSKQEMKDRIKRADVLFLTGGDPKLLLESLKELELKKEIINFNGLVVGFSAGGMILSKTGVIPAGMDKNYPKTIYFDGLGFIEESFIPHYDEKFDENLKKISKKIDLYAIKGSNALYIDLLTGDRESLGETNFFTKGEKVLSF